jgi:hypothetical protein
MAQGRDHNNKKIPGFNTAATSFLFSLSRKEDVFEYQPLKLAHEA